MGGAGAGNGSGSGMDAAEFGAECIAGGDGGNGGVGDRVATPPLPLILRARN